MKEPYIIDRQTLLPPASASDIQEMLSLFDLLQAQTPAEYASSANAPLRADEACPPVSVDALRAYFPALGQDGIEMPCIMPKPEEKA